MRSLCLVCVLAWTAVAAGQANPVVAIVGATVDTGLGETLEGATVLIRGERIAAVGVGLAVPEGAVIVDAAGKRLTPGLFGLGTDLGLVEIAMERSTVDASPEDLPDPIRASFDAADGFNPRSSLIPIARTGGITTAVSTPDGGLVSGTSCLVDLRSEGLDEMVSRPRLALHVDLGGAGVGAAGGARPSALSRLREALEDARLYARNRGAFDRRGLREMRVSRLDLERLAEAVAGRLPVVVQVSRASDILRVLALGREYGLRLTLSGVEEGWVVAPRIAEAQVAVIVSPLTNLPYSFSALGSRDDNAALLSDAGVSVAFGTPGGHGAHDLRTLRQAAGNAIARGMDWQAALAAVTSTPARVFGLEGDYGAVAAGKLANLVLWSGDPFELESRALRVWVRGNDASLHTRQTDLFERYRQLRSLERRDWSGRR